MTWRMKGRVPMIMTGFRGMLGKLQRFGALAGLALVSAGLLSSQTRDIRTKILADEEFRGKTGWAEKIEKLMAAASAEFDNAFGIKFNLSQIEEWNSDNSLRSLELLAEDLDRKALRGDADVLVAITAQPNLSEPFRGYSYFQEAIVVVKDTKNTTELVKTLEHELAHLFGAVHVGQPDSLMDIYTRGDVFDPANARLIALNKFRSFSPGRFPVPKESWDEAISTYKLVVVSTKMAKSEIALSMIKDPWMRQHDKFLEDAHVLLAQILIEKKDYEQALDECEKALAVNRENLEAFNLKGIALRRKGLIDQAIATYQDILKAKPFQARIHYNLGVAYSKLGNLEAARRAYEKALEIKPRYPEAHANLGDIFLRQGHEDDAAREFQAALDIAPQFAMAHANLAEVHLRNKEYAKCLSEIEAALALDPDLPAAHCTRGNLYYKEGDIEQAEREYLKTLALDPQNEKAHFNLGNCYLEYGQPVEAEKSFFKAIQANARFAEPHAQLGYCLLLQNRPDQAVREILAAHQAGFHSAATFLNLSSAYLKLNEPDQAAIAARRSSELDSQLAAAIMNLGISYTLKKLYPEAAGQFLKVIALEPDNKDGWKNLGGLYFEMGDLDQALPVYLQALHLDPLDAVLHNNVGVIYFRKENYLKAQEHVQRAQDLGHKVHPMFIEALKKKRSPEGET